MESLKRAVEAKAIKDRFQGLDDPESAVLAREAQRIFAAETRTFGRGPKKGGGNEWKRLYFF